LEYLVIMDGRFGRPLDGPFAGCAGPARAKYGFTKANLDRESRGALAAPYWSTSSAYKTVENGVCAITEEKPGPPKPKPRRANARPVSGEGDALGRERELAQLARDILQSRRQRNGEFGKRLFSEPAWDMLLELYVRENTGVAATSRDLIAASGAARSTAARWIAHLDKESLIRRRRHPGDSATDFIELTDLGRDSLERYLSAIQAELR
jgi:DNA-binding MarR family transcriptional regulator